MSLFTSHNDNEYTIIPGSVHEKVCFFLKGFVTKTGALLSLFRVHVYLFRAHNYHGILNCCTAPPTLIDCHITGDI